MREELGNAFTVVVPANGLSKQALNRNDRELAAASLLLLRDREGVGDDDTLNALAFLHLLEAIATKETVRRHAVDLRSATTLHNGLGSSNPRSGLVDHVVNYADGTVPHVTDKSDSSLELRVLEVLFFGFRGVASIVRATHGLSQFGFLN